MKNLITLALAILMCLSVCACTPEPAPSPADTTEAISDTATEIAAETEAATEAETTEPDETGDGMGGTNTQIFYEKPFNHIYYNAMGNTTVKNFLEAEGYDLKEWLNEWRDDKNTQDPRPLMGLLDMIHDCHIPKDVFVKLVEAETDNAYFPLTMEMVDALYSDDIKLFRETFVNESSIYANGEIYTPEMLHKLSFEDMKSLGITEEMIAEKMVEWQKSLPYTTYLKYMIDLCAENDIEYEIFYPADGFADVVFSIVPENKYADDEHMKYFSVTAD